MKKLFLLCLVVAAAIAAWKFAGQSSGDDALAELEHRLEAAETAYGSAGRAASMAGLDTTADAEAALAEIGRVEEELRDMGRTATSNDVKTRIRQALDRAAAIRNRIR